MKKVEIIIIVIYLLLAAFFSIDGILEEANTGDRANGLVYMTKILPSLSIAAALISRMFIKHQKFIVTFFKSSFISFIVLLGLGLIGKIYFFGAAEGFNWFISLPMMLLLNPLEIIIPLGLVFIILFIIQGSVSLITKLVGKMI
jgi:hypothetical protein